MAAAERLDASQAWDRVHADTRWNVWVPAEDVARFAARHLFERVGPRETLPRRPFAPILDLGCGVGRHLVFFRQLGFEVMGTDVSPGALRASRSWLAREGLSAELAASRVDAIPAVSRRFGTVVSHGVLDHVTLAEAHGALAEVRRVLMPGGLVHLSLRMRDSFDYGIGSEIEPGTYRLETGHERGLPQHFWTDAEIEALLEGFDVLDWETDRRAMDRSGERVDTRCAVSAALR